MNAGEAQWPRWRQLQKLAAPCSQPPAPATLYGLGASWGQDYSYCLTCVFRFLWLVFVGIQLWMGVDNDLLLSAGSPRLGG